MKKIFLLTVVLCCLLPTNLYARYDQPQYEQYSQPRHEQYGQMPRFLFSVGAGAFTPQGDIDNFDTGGNVTLSGIVAFARYFGIGVDVNFNNSHHNESDIEDKIDTSSFEVLLYIQPNESMVQPYLAIGAGSYYNHLREKAYIVGVDYTVTDEDGVGYGLVGKAGVRAFINDNLYVGLFGKLFSNNQDTDRLYVVSNHTVGETINLGGYVICGEIGFRF
ncbi:MAG: outer membrane beta-barrel protein [Syntrophales bacterium]|jgi:hypothetical protein